MYIDYHSNPQLRCSQYNTVCRKKLGSLGTGYPSPSKTSLLPLLPTTTWSIIISSICPSYPTSKTSKINSQPHLLTHTSIPAISLPSPAPLNPPYNFLPPIPVLPPSTNLIRFSPFPAWAPIKTFSPLPQSCPSTHLPMTTERISVMAEW